MKLQIPDKLEFLLRPKRYKIAFGGRGGYKTETYARVLLAKGAESRINVLCAREIQKSIEASVHSTLKRLIREMSMQHLYDVQSNAILGKNGTVFRFAGLFRNIESIKSADEIDVCWVEEAETVSEDSWDTLIPTIRKEGSEIWISFNPKDEFSWVWNKVKPHIDSIRSQDYYEDSRTYIVKTYLEENPFATKELLEESRELKEKNPKLWMHIYGGEVYSDYTDSIIQPEWFDAAINAHRTLGFKPIGVKAMGFDIADTGDAKAIYMRYGSVIMESERWTTGELPEAIDKAFETATKTGAEFLVYDADGMGASMKVYLANVTTNKRIEVIPYYGGGKVDNPGQTYTTYDGQPEGDKKSNKDTFRNKRSQYYVALADRFQATYNAVTKGIYTDPERLISLSSELKHLDILKSELIKIKRIVGNNSFIQIQSKKDAMKEGIKSPNDADALKMCFANPAPSAQIVELNFESEWG
jgi:phage terminase large subunit